MNSLRIEELALPGARLGAENPLPELANVGGANTPMKISPEIPEEDRKYFGYGANRSILPYPLQTDYDRTRMPRRFRAVVMENEILKATFLPQLGGRLWSLYHKPLSRELLYVNPVFQPANLALRNAWISGGVEWNMSFCGHHPFTCAPLHTARVMDADGNQILRMYEWERLRGLLFQMDVSLPPGSPVLLVRVRLVNGNPHEIPTYWWSNIAVPQNEGHRVLVPANWAMSFGYGGELARIPVPYGKEGRDNSYPTHIESSNDFFFRLPDNVAPWITALDGQGKGLFQTSTSNLRGRKLFVWGTSAGGQRWQEFLSEPGHPYTEIQAGLGRTQAECVPMPALADWAWMEAYGLLEADADCVHGRNWDEAVAHAGRKIAEVISPEALERRLAETALLADTPPVEILQLGSGWGALEELRRAKQGERPLGKPGTPFPVESLTARQQPWKVLLETGCFPATEAGWEDPNWVIQKPWLELLEEAVAAGSDHYESWFHLGLMAFAQGSIDQARTAWERSLALFRSPVVLRNLSVLAAWEGDQENRVKLIKEAWERAPEVSPLAIECLNALLEADLSKEAAGMAETLPAPIREHGRVRLILGKAWLQLGEMDKLRQLFDSGWEVEDLKEGDNSVSDLWIAYQRALEPARYHDDPPPVPPRFDFRMRVPEKAV